MHVWFMVPTALKEPSINTTTGLRTGVLESDTPAKRSRGQQLLRKTVVVVRPISLCRFKFERKVKHYGKKPAVPLTEIL